MGEEQKQLSLAEVDGVTEDDPNAPDEEEDLEALLDEEGEGEATGGEEQTDAAATTEATTPASKAAADPEARFTQGDLERIIGERLARDRKATQVRQLEAVAGVPLEQLVDQYRQHEVERVQEQFAMTEDEAKAYVTQQEELRSLKAEQESLRNQQQAMQSAMAYQREKAQHLANPLVRQYEADIDAFAENGAALPFEAAMAYVLGTKVLSGEVLGQVRQAAQQQTLANVRRRAQVAPESTTAGKPQTGGLAPREKWIAARLGITANEYAREKAKTKGVKQK